MDRSLARSLIYNTLSLCYLYPDEKVYASIAAGEWIRGFKDALHLLDEENFDDCLRPFEQAIIGPSEDEQLAMVREYTRLFIDASPYVIAPLYGSFYLEKEGLDSGGTTSEVLRIYHEAGFTPKEDLHPAHLAYELEFMGLLADQESRASGGGRIRLEEVQMDFLSRYITSWVPFFCKKVTEQSLLPFYSILGNLTQEFIGFEQNYLGMPEEKEPCWIVLGCSKYVYSDCPAYKDRQKPCWEQAVTHCKKLLSVKWECKDCKVFRIRNPW